MKTFSNLLSPFLAWCDLIGKKSVYLKHKYYNKACTSISVMVLAEIYKPQQSVFVYGTRDCKACWINNVYPSKIDDWQRTAPKEDCSLNLIL